MTKKFAVGALLVVLLMSGLLVGASYGGNEGDPGTVTDEKRTETVIRLNWSTRGEGSVVQFFAFDPSGGSCDDSDPICAQITLKDLPIFDRDGTQVGLHHIQCTMADFTAVESVDWFCHWVTQLKEGPYTDLGQLTGVGIKRPNGDTRFPITGGTGAYEDAGGYVFQSGDTGKVTFTIHLAP